MALVAKKPHHRRVHLIAPFASLMHCSARAALIAEGDAPPIAPDW
jgi:hypothetical protein